MLILPCWKMKTAPKLPVGFLKTKLQKTSFRLVNFDVSLVRFLENRYPTNSTGSAHPNWNVYQKITLSKHTVRSWDTHMIHSIWRGLIKIAMGCRPTSWRRFIAFPLTSSRQCLPCTNIINLYMVSQKKWHNFKTVLTHCYHVLFHRSFFWQSSCINFWPKFRRFFIYCTLGL